MRIGDRVEIRFSNQSSFILCKNSNNKKQMQKFFVEIIQNV